MTFADICNRPSASQPSSLLAWNCQRLLKRLPSLHVLSATSLCLILAEGLPDIAFVLSVGSLLNHITLGRHTHSNPNLHHTQCCHALFLFLSQSIITIAQHQLGCTTALPKAALSAVRLPTSVTRVFSILHAMLMHQLP